MYDVVVQIWYAHKCVQRVGLQAVWHVGIAQGFVSMQG